MKMFVKIALVLVLGLISCKKGGLISDKEVSEKKVMIKSGPSMLSKIIDQSLLPKILGKFKPVDPLGGRTKMQMVEITPTTIRCNNSSRDDKYVIHKYGVVYAMNGKVLLRVKEGRILMTLGEGVKVSLKTAGICRRGIRGYFRESLYKRIEVKKGNPSLLIRKEPRYNRTKRTARINEKLKFSQGAITVENIRLTSWSRKTRNYPVIEMEIVISAGPFAIEPFLAHDLMGVAGIQGTVKVSCEGVKELGYYITTAGQHPKPAFNNDSDYDEERKTVLLSNERRRGWVVVGLKKKPVGVCKIYFDAIGLGGPILVFSKKFK